LPQEVKEIGNDQALIFYEGVRPIRCRKIRYYVDRRLRARLLPPPPHATPVVRKSSPARPSPPVAAPAPTIAAGESLAAESRVVETAPTVTAALENIDRLESLTIEDFGDRLKGLQFEQAGERPTDSELDADVDRLLDALR
jgi:hypothetical protein